MAYIPAILVFLLLPYMLPAQVVNDNISSRLSLELNKPLNSNTIKSTVEWKCLNQNLTRSCIKYHNDQWFEFTPQGSGPYFINVSGQDCRDIWGIQVIVFSGEPCEPETYELVTCYSDGNKDDIFIRLPNLERGITYLLNVDGYLHDLCSFQIEFSDTPRGLPVEGGSGRISEKTTLRSATISWEVSDELASDLYEYELWKRSEEVYRLLAKRPHERNAIGESRLSYSYKDSVGSDRADYLVIAVSENDRIKVGEVSVVVDQQALADAPENNITVSIDEEPGDPLEIEIWDADDSEILATYRLSYNPEVRISYNIMRYRRDGTSFFKVVIRNLRTGTFDLQFFEK